MTSTQDDDNDDDDNKALLTGVPKTFFKGVFKTIWDTHQF